MPKSFSEIIDLYFSPEIDCDWQKLPEMDINEIHNIFLKNATKNGNIKYFDKSSMLESYLGHLRSLPLGKWRDNQLQFFSTVKNITNSFCLRIKCEQYIQEQNIDAKERLLHEIQFFLETVVEKERKELVKKNYYKHFSVVKLAYFADDIDLIALFKEHFPVPAKSAFEPDAIPASILKIENEKDLAISQFIKRDDISFVNIEKSVIRLQRRYRSQKRKNEERKRVAEVYHNQFPNELTQEQLDEQCYTIYTPQKCNPALAMRIVAMAGKVKFFENICHKTNSFHISSILDDGLYGRDTLESKHMSYFGASLFEGDVKNGDGNVICCGAEYGRIDPLARGDTTLIFKFDTLNLSYKKSDHNAFFKQKDLGFKEELKIRTVDTKFKKLLFTHTSDPHPVLNRHEKGYQTMYLGFLEHEDVKETVDVSHIQAFSLIHSLNLISYNINEIDRTLILNFFRFLDNAEVYDRRNVKYPAKDSEFISDIYSMIEEMTDDELFDFLRSVGMACSDTMEFNFLGSHLINFDSVVKIKIEVPRGIQYNHGFYTLELSNLIKELQDGCLKELNTANMICPNLFKSYRLIDYLSKQTNNLEALQALMDLRSKCDVPSWYPLNPKLSPLLENHVPMLIDFDRSSNRKRKRSEEIESRTKGARPCI